MKRVNDKPLTYQEACRIQKRICMNLTGTDNNCHDCPLDLANNGEGIRCNTFVLFYASKAEPILKKWASEHPVKTNKDKFVEVFGRPDFRDKSCMRLCAGSEVTPCNGCDWWNDEYVEPEGTDE